MTIHEQVAGYMVKKYPKPIAFDVRFCEILDGDSVDGLFLAQLMYWTCEAYDGWFKKSYEEWKQAIKITRRNYESARKLCIDKGFMQEKLHGYPPVLHFKANLPEIHRSIEALVAMPADIRDVMYNCTNPPVLSTNQDLYNCTNTSHMSTETQFVQNAKLHTVVHTRTDAQGIIKPTSFLGLGEEKIDPELIRINSPLEGGELSDASEGNELVLFDVQQAETTLATPKKKESGGVAFKRHYLAFMGREITLRKEQVINLNRIAKREKDFDKLCAVYFNEFAPWPAKENAYDADTFIRYPDKWAGAAIKPIPKKRSEMNAEEVMQDAAERYLTPGVLEVLRQISPEMKGQ